MIRNWWIQSGSIKTNFNLHKCSKLSCNLENLGGLIMFAVSIELHIDSENLGGLIMFAMLFELLVDPVH